MLDAPIDTDLLCCRCGYNLRTRTAADVCPECGLSVHASVEFQKAQPSLAFGARRLGVGAALMGTIDTLALVGNVYLTIIGYLLPRASGTAAYNLPMAAQYIFLPAASIVAYAVMASARLAPRYMRWGGVHATLLNLFIGVSAILSLVLAGLVLLQYPGGVPLTQWNTGLRYFLYFVGGLVTFPIQIYIFLFLFALARRPEFAGLRIYTMTLLVVGLVSLSVGVTVNAYFVYAIATLSRPSESIFSFIRLIGCLRLGAHGLVVVYWFLLSRKAFRAARFPAPLAHR